MDYDRSHAKLLEKRDLVNFVRLRCAHPGDDLLVGELLVHSFRETNAKKMPELSTSPRREVELRDVNSRRLNGIVRVIELGYQLIGTYSLIYPRTALDESWTANTCTLRCVAIDPKFHSLKLSEQLVSDAIEVATRSGADKICLHVQAGAEGVASLYKKFGFVRAQEGDKIWMGNSIEGYLLDLKS